MNDEINKRVLEITKIARQIKIPDNVEKLVEMTERFQKNVPKFDFPQMAVPKFDFPKLDVPSFPQNVNSKLVESLEEFSRIAERINNNPEFHFAMISNLEALNLKSTTDLKKTLIYNLTDEDIQLKEELLNKNLLPFLEELQLDSLWIGANIVLENKSNPDKLRHCLISLRTLLEFLIDEKLAPIEELKSAEMFKSKFRKYHLGKQKIEFIKIKRAEKIEYFASKFEYDFLEDFTKNEIQYICDCYSVLCNVHKPEIGISENQVRSLKVKTGITIWLLMYLNEILK